MNLSKSHTGRLPLPPFSIPGCDPLNVSFFMLNSETDGFCHLFLFFPLSFIALLPTVLLAPLNNRAKVLFIPDITNKHRTG